MRSGATLVKRHAAIVMEPAKFGDCVDASLPRERPRNRLLVPRP